MADPQINVIIEDLDRYSERTVVGLGLEVTANLREDTPRDTSWARSNWLPSVGRPAPPLAEPKGRASAGDVAGARALQAAGEANLRTYRLERGSVFSTNNVPYIASLNAGSSKQAGPQFVERSVERAVHEVARLMR